MPIKRTQPAAIAYTSNTGHTRQYALLLGKQIGLPAYSLEEACSQLSGGSPVIYLGWLHASHVKGYSKAAKRFVLCAVCGVGLCDTGALICEVRKATSIPKDIPLFTLQGGIDRSRLKGMDKLMISMLTKGLPSGGHLRHRPVYRRQGIMEGAEEIPRMDRPYEAGHAAISGG